MKKIFITLLIVSAVFATQYVTIPTRQVGILIGKADAPVKLELIYDPGCDGSAQFDQNFQKAYNALTSDIKSQISQRFISLSLPYHMASQKQTQAIIYVLNNKGSQQALVLLRDFLTHISTWSQDAIKNQSINVLMTKIAQRVTALFGLKSEEVLKQLKHTSSTDGKLRGWTKVVTGSMRVASTPRLRINGVTVDGATDLTVPQLTKLMTDIVNQTQQVEQIKIIN